MGDVMMFAWCATSFDVLWYLPYVGNKLRR
jgi:hypothetical protein